MTKQFDPLVISKQETPPSDLVPISSINTAPRPNPSQSGSTPPSDLVPLDKPVSVYLKGSNEMVEMPSGMLERIGKIASDSYKVGDAETEKNIIYTDKWFGNNQPYYQKRISELKAISGQDQLDPQGLLEKAVAATAEQTPQLVEMAKKVFTRGAQGGAIGAVGGAAVGSVVPVVGTASGAVSGGLLGVRLGMQAGIVENSFIQNLGSSYEEYSNYTTKDGKTLEGTDEARVAAVISATSQTGLDIISLKAMSKIIPFKSKIMDILERTGAKSVVLPKGKEATLKFVRDLATAQATEVLTEGAQEGIQAWVGEGLKKYLSEQEILPAKDGEISDRVVKAMEKTALSVIPITTVAATGGKGLEVAVNKISQKKSQAAKPLDEKISDIAKQADPAQEFASAPVASFSKEEQTVLKDAGVVDENNNVNVPTGEQNLAGVLSKIQGSRRDGALTETTNEIQSNIDSTVLEGRLKKLDDNISTIDKQIDVVTQLIETKQNKNQATVRDEQKLNTLVNRRDLFDEERANILTTQTPRSTETLTLGDKTANIEVKSGALSLAEDSNVTLKGSKLQNIGQTAIRDINKSFREGRSLAKKDVTEAQNFITTVIDQSALAPTDKAKFIRTIKNIQDADGLIKKLPEVQSRISNLVEAASRRQLKSDIKSALSKTKTKKQSGKPVGKFGAETQKTLDRLRNASKLSVQDAKDLLGTRNEIAANDSKSGKLPSYDDALEAAVLSSVADSDNTRVSDLQKLKEDIEQIVTEGKTSRQNTLLAKKAKVEKIQDGISQLITQGRDLEFYDETFKKAAANRLVTLQASINYAWGDIIDSILPPSKVDLSLKESIVKDLNISKEIQKEKGIQRVRRDKFIDAAKEAYGFSKEGDLHDKFLQDSKPEVIGVFVNSAGKRKRLKYSKAQARKFWMELQDPSLKETIESPEGMGFTPEMINAVTSTLDHKDISFAKAQLKLYEEFYPEINKVYSRVYGVDLPSIENYSPISRVVDKDLDTNVGEFMQETFVRLSIAPGSLKSRVNNLGELRKGSDIEVYQKHIVEMAHFVALQEKVQQIQQVFSSKDLRSNIETVAGKSYLSLIDDTVDSFARNGAVKSGAWGNAINYLNSGFARSVLGGKAILAAKQMTSTLAYYDGMSAKDFTAGVLDFAKNPKKAIEILNQSELVKARGVPEYDLAKMGRSDDLLKSVANRNSATRSIYRRSGDFFDAMLLPVKLGDKGAIFVGGWAYYKNQIKQGKTHEEALQAFEEFTAKTQQSTDIDQITQLQRSGPFGRTVSMFITAPNAYYRAEMRAIRQFRRGEISGKEFGKKLFIYHILLPATFQFVANGFTFDEEDQLIAAATGPLNGFFIFGDAISNGIRALLDQETFQQSSLRFTKFAEEIWQGVAEIAQSGGDMEDVLEGVQDISKGAGRVVGLPVDQAKNMAEGIDDFDSDRPVRGTLRFLGYPKKSVEEIDN